MPKEIEDTCFQYFFVSMIKYLKSYKKIKQMCLTYGVSMKLLRKVH